MKASTQNTEERWEPAIEALLQHDLASLEFILQQAKELFGDTLEVRRNHEARNVGLLSALIPTTLAVFSILFGIIEVPDTPFLRESTVFTVLSLSASVFICVISLTPHKRFRSGSLPGDLFQSEWGEFPEEKRRKFYISNEIISYQTRCEKNLALSESSSNRLTLTAYLAASAPASYLLTISINAVSSDGILAFLLWYWSHIFFGIFISNKALCSFER